MFTYQGIEEAILRLKRARVEQSHLIHLVVPGGDPNRDRPLGYELVPTSGYNPGHSLSPLWRATTYVLESLLERDEAWLGFQGDKLFSFVPRSEAGIVYFGEVNLVKDPKDKRKVKIPIIEFENGTICRTIQEYLRFFDLEDTYTNRGKVISWINNQKGEAKTLRRKPQEYDPKRVISFTMGKNTFGKFVGILNYRGLPPLVGFGPIIQTFPNLTLSQAKSLYQDHQIPLPSTLKKHFKLKKSGSKKTTFDYDYYIERYTLFNNGDGMNFEDSTDSMVMTSPEKLCEELRGHGETITQVETQELWKVVMGED